MQAKRPRTADQDGAADARKRPRSETPPVTGQPSTQLASQLPAPAPSLMPMPQAYPASGPVPAAAQPPNAPQQVSVQVGPVKSPLLWPGLAVCGWATGPTLQGVHGARAAEVEMWAVWLHMSGFMRNWVQVAGPWVEFCLM